MVISVQVKGADELNRFLVNLPRGVDKEINLVSDKWVRFVQRSAKMRAPRRTGELANSIKVFKQGKNNWAIIVGSPYGAFQEEGFRPHQIHADMDTRTGNRVGSIMGFEGFATVRKFTPFIKPALEAGLNRLPLMLQDSIQKAIKRSKR